MTHVCKSLPTNPDGREKREGRPHGCTTSCGAGTELHGHLGFSSSVFIAKINVSSQYSRVNCLSPTFAKHSSRVAEEGAGSPGDSGQAGPGHLLVGGLGALTRPTGSGLPTALQLHLLGQLPPDGQQRAGSIGRTGQQLLEPRPFFLTARMESGGQWEGWVRSNQQPQGHPRHSHPTGRHTSTGLVQGWRAGCEAGCGAMRFCLVGLGVGADGCLKPGEGGTSGRRGGAALGPVGGHTGPSFATTVTRSCCLRWGMHTAHSRPHTAAPRQLGPTGAGVPGPVVMGVCSGPTLPAEGPGP